MVNRTWAFALVLALAGAPISSVLAASLSGGTTIFLTRLRYLSRSSAVITREGIIWAPIGTGRPCLAMVSVQVSPSIRNRPSDRRLSGAVCTNLQHPFRSKVKFVACYDGTGAPIDKLEAPEGASLQRGLPG
jgi:hypothetical protein